jgi:hypothetical protein
LRGRDLWRGRGCGWRGWGWSCTSKRLALRGSVGRAATKPPTPLRGAGWDTHLCFSSREKLMNRGTTILFLPPAKTSGWAPGRSETGLTDRIAMHLILERDTGNRRRPLSVMRCWDARAATKPPTPLRGAEWGTRFCVFGGGKKGGGSSRWENFWTCKRETSLLRSFVRFLGTLRWTTAYGWGVAGSVAWRD